MSMKNIVPLAVLISLVPYNIIQAGIIRGVNIPQLDVEKMVGKWYLLTSDKSLEPYGGLACTTYHIEQQSSDRFTLKKTEKLKPETKKLMPDAKDEHSEIIDCSIVMNSNIIMMNQGYGFEMPLVVFDIDYDSYMATYMTDEKERVYEGYNGDVSIFSRHKTLPQSVVDNILQSNFYQQGVSYENKQSLRISNITGCP